jgi:hypothetical protein
VFLPALFCLVLISGANKKFDLGARRYSVARGKNRMRIAPHTAPSLEFWNDGRELVSRVDVMTCPFLGTGSTYASPRFSRGSASLTPISSRKFPVKPDGISTITWDAARFLEHALEAKMAEITVDQILRFIL